MLEYGKSFLVGGIICVLAQILMDKTKMLPGRIMVTLVVTGCILGAIGVYEPIVNWAGCGATVPLTGFGYALWNGVKESINMYGFLGLFRGGLKAAATGTSAALIFSYIASFLFQPKMKK